MTYAHYCATRSNLTRSPAPLRPLQHDAHVRRWLRWLDVQWLKHQREQRETSQ
jgi:hypothetical protein